MSEIEGFAERIFSLRKAANKNQEEVGMALGLTKSGVSSFEKGKSIPSPENLLKLASLFGVSVDYLLTGRDSLSKVEKNKYIDVSNTSPIYPAPADSKSSGVFMPNGYSPVEKPGEHLVAVEDALEVTQALFKQILAEGKITQVTFRRERIVKNRSNQLNASGITANSAALPVFDQSQIDKRFLTELDRLLKINTFPTYTAWAQAVEVSPNYVSAIEKGRYHFNIELLYNTARHFPGFDFIYVVFGSSLSNRPEPTELPKRERGRRQKANRSFRERLKDIIVENELVDTGMLPGDHNDLANDKEVYNLYASEYGPIKENSDYVHHITLVINSIIDEIKAGLDKD